MPPVGFEPTISAGARPQTDALDRAAIGTGVTALHRVQLFQRSNEVVLLSNTVPEDTRHSSKFLHSDDAGTKHE